MTKLRATTSLAAKIAHIDRQRFNEAIAAGYYPCAPEIFAGRSRSFDVLDLLTLCIYGHLLKEGVTPRHAGHTACDFRKYIGEFPDADTALQVTTAFNIKLNPGSWVPPHMHNEIVHWIGKDEIVSRREWLLKPMRDFIIKRLEEEDARRVIGDADEEG